MNYSDIQNIGTKIDTGILIQQLNDEGRSPDLIELTDEADAIVVRFNQAAAEAKGIIDPYLSRYELPFVTVPPRIKDISDDLTLYCIHKRRNRESIPDSIVAIYKDNIKTLESIQKGVLNLGIAEKVLPASQGEFRVNKTLADKVFTKDLMMRF